MFKIFLSKETRQTAEQILKSIRRSKEWKEDLVIVEGEFRSREKEQTLLLITHMLRLLATKKWDTEGVQRARFVSVELVRNAFEHGLMQNPKGKVHVRAEVSSDFLKIAVTDPGLGFDLAAELEEQGAKDRHSKRCRALAFIYRMATDLSQHVTRHGHTVSATLQKAYTPCEIEKVDNITVFEFKGETQPIGYFWAEVVREIEELPSDSKVVLDFSRVNDISTRLISEVVRLLAEHGWIERELLGSPGPSEFLATLVRTTGGQSSVVVCGCDNVNYVLRDFLRTRFRVFPAKDQAIEYLLGQNPVTPPDHQSDIE